LTFEHAKNPYNSKSFVTKIYVKLIIQIPCFNEAETLEQVVSDLPSALVGIDSIEVLVIDDSSTDNTISLTSALGDTWVVSHKRNRGLASAFATGLNHSLALGADIIVNTDGDHQYRGHDIAALVAPILSGKADLVIGDRCPTTDLRLKWVKRQLHRLGQMVVSNLAGQRLTDPVSGFRAYSRLAASRTHIVTGYTYTIESLLQAAHKGLAIQFVPITTNPATRPSRLFRNLPQFVFRSAVTLLRVFFMFHPLHVLVGSSFCLAMLGLVPIVRFLVFFTLGDGDGHVQSLVLGATLIVLACLLLVAGLIADLVSHNRQLLEKSIEAIDQRGSNFAHRVILQHKIGQGKSGEPIDRTE
jgi:glycosyltransferase involved in cell wall biosynthesis